MKTSISKKKKAELTGWVEVSEKEPQSKIMVVGKFTRYNTSYFLCYFHKNNWYLWCNNSWIKPPQYWSQTLNTDEKRIPNSN